MALAGELKQEVEQELELELEQELEDELEHELEVELEKELERAIEKTKKRRSGSSTPILFGVVHRRNGGMEDAMVVHKTLLMR